MRASFAIVLFGVCFGTMGCRPDIYRINGLGSVSVIEHERVLELQVMNVMYASGFGYRKLFLVEKIPTDRPLAEVRLLVDQLPTYRDRSTLLQANNKVLSILTNQPSKPLSWIIGTDPLIIAIGGQQGRVSPRGDDFTRQYPLVGSSDLQSLVHTVVVFPPDSWDEIENARDSSDMSAIDFEIVEFDRPRTLADVLEETGPS